MQQLHFFVWIFFIWATNLVAHKKGWGTETPGFTNLRLRNIDWTFFAAFVGPPIFLIICAIPARWSIPDEELYISFREAQEAYVKLLEEKQTRNFIENFFYDKIQSLKEFFFLFLFFMGPVVQIIIILKFGFDWSDWDWATTLNDWATTLN